MDSQDMTITYKAIQERANSDALERMPALPTVNSFDAWEAFQSDVEDLDAFDIASESSEWDWVIYFNRALELCQAVPRDVLDEAELQWQEIGHVDSSFGLYELAHQLAAIIVEREIVEAVEAAKAELIDLAQNQMESFE